MCPAKPNMEKDVGNTSLKFFLCNVMLIKESVCEKAKTATMIIKNATLHFQILVQFQLTFFFCYSMKTTFAQQRNTR
jgi:hypothetical protein